MSLLCQNCGKEHKGINEVLDCDCKKPKPTYNKKRLLLIITAVTIICFIAFVFIMVKMIQQNGECINNPLVYSAIKLKENGGNYLCSCQSLDMGLLDFSFDENGINIIKPMDYNNIDYSKLNFTVERG